MKRPAPERGGFTLIEVTIAMALIAILLVKLTMIVHEATTAHERESASMALEDQAQTVLDRVAYAIIGSDPDTLQPLTSAPFFAGRLEYRVSLGVEDGVVVWSDEEVGLDDDPSNLSWTRDPGGPTEQVVVWCRTVAALLEDEIQNGDDDNDNGLADETGLSFVIEGSAVTIRLTLQRETENGIVEHTRETVVTCRN